VSKSSVTLSREKQIEILSKLREARYLVLRDAEAFHEAATTLEYVGQILTGTIRTGLARYKAEIVNLALQTKRHDEGEISRLFEVVREARNDAVHVGAFARHLNTRLIDLLLILEEAIMSQMNEIQDLMVRNPVVAEPWQLGAHVRNVMLANSFSNLPIRLKFDGTERWMILTAVAVMKVIRGTAQNERSNRLSMTIELAVAKGLIKPELATCVSPKTAVKDVVAKMNHLAVLVTETNDEKERLLGIVTPFDVL